MTYKQKAVARDLLENTGKSVSKAMFDAGYAPASAKNPQQLTRSKSWQKLMKTLVPDQSLIQKHKKLLEATTMRKMVIPYVIPDSHLDVVQKFLSQGIGLYMLTRSHKETFIFYYEADKRAQLQALALAYKLKGKLHPNIIVNGENVIALLQSSNINYKK